LKRSRIGISLLLVFFAFSLSAQDPLKNFFSLGAEYFKKGDYSDALFNYKEALRLYPKSQEILNNIGICYQNLKDYDNAIKYYQSSLAIDKDYTPALNNLGLLYVKTNMFPDIGVSMIRRAMLLEPDNLEYIDSLGQSYYELKDYENALVWFNKALNNGLSNEKVHYHLGECYLKLGKREESLKEFKKVLEISPSYLIAYFGIIKILQKYEEYDLSMAYLVKLNRFALNISMNNEKDFEIEEFLSYFYKDALLNLSSRILREEKRFNYKYPKIEDCIKWVSNNFKVKINPDYFFMKGLDVYTSDGLINPQALKYSGLIKDSYIKQKRKCCMLRLRINKLDYFLTKVGYNPDNNDRSNLSACPLGYSYRKIEALDYKCERHGEYKIGNQ